MNSIRSDKATPTGKKALQIISNVVIVDKTGKEWYIISSVNGGKERGEVGDLLLCVHFLKHRMPAIGKE